MSFYGELPGAKYSNKNRVGEKCSAYRHSSVDAGLHMLTIIELDCIDYADPASCIGYCE